MIYEVRTYTLKPGSVAQFEENFGKALPHREKYSKLGGFWHTEIGPLTPATIKGLSAGPVCLSTDGEELRESKVSLRFCSVFHHVFVANHLGVRERFQERLGIGSFNRISKPCPAVAGVMLATALALASSPAAALETINLTAIDGYPPKSLWVKDRGGGPVVIRDIRLEERTAWGARPWPPVA